MQVFYVIQFIYFSLERVFAVTIERKSKKRPKPWTELSILNCPATGERMQIEFSRRNVKRLATQMSITSHFCLLGCMI